MSATKRAIDAAVARMERRKHYSPDERARLEQNFPWPCDDSRRDAAESLAHERDRRVATDLGNALDVGVPKEPTDVVLSDEQTVTIIVQALRGQRVRWTPDVPARGEPREPSA